MVAVSFGIDTRLRRGMDRPLLRGEKQTCHVSASTLVIHGRLQNDLDDADRPDRR